MKVSLGSILNNLGGREWVAIEVVGDRVKCFLVWSDVSGWCCVFHTGVDVVFCVYALVNVFCGSLWSGAEFVAGGSETGFNDGLNMVLTSTNSTMKLNGV